jgi:hypothetical protein
MLQHRSVDEHYWFRCIVDGEPLSYFVEHGLEGAGEWTVSADETPTSLVDHEGVSASPIVQGRNSEPVSQQQGRLRP